jgi:hypothetical protein
MVRALVDAPATKPLIAKPTNWHFRIGVAITTDVVAVFDTLVQPVPRAVASTVRF